MRIDPFSGLVGALVTLAVVLMVSHKQLTGTAAHARSIATREDRVTRMLAEHVKLHEQQEAGLRAGGGASGSAVVQRALPAGETDESLKQRPNIEHIEKLKDPEYHRLNKDKWVLQTNSRPFELGLRTKPCADAAATAANSMGVNLVRGIVDDETLAATPDFTTALEAFEQAVVAEPTCVAARLNSVMLQAAIACHPDRVDDKTREKDALAAIRDDVLKLKNSVSGDVAANVGLSKELRAEVYLWVGIIEEIADASPHAKTDARDAYRQAFQIDPQLHAEHIHPNFNNADPTILRELGQTEAHYRRSLVCLLFYYEFAPAMGGYPKLSYEQTQQFLRDWHVKVDGALPPYVFAIVVRTYRNVFDLGLLKGVIHGYKGASSQSSNSDCISSWYNVRVKEFVRRLAGTEVVPTYGYVAGYETGDELKAHTDRKACEFTLTTLVEAYPHPGYCPLLLQKTPWVIDRKWVGRYEMETMNKDDVVNLHPQLNQWLILRGRAKPHFRPPLAEGVTCTTFLSHFVPEGEPS